MSTEFSFITSAPGPQLRNRFITYVLVVDGVPSTPEPTEGHILVLKR